MKVALALFVLFLGVAGCSNSSDSSTDGTPCEVVGFSPRIINGSACEAGNNPFVLLSIADEDANTAETCSGTLIAPTVVLTAGHCVPTDADDIDGLTVSVAGQLAAVTSVAVHPGYDVRDDLQQVLYDIAIVRLDRPIAAPTLPIVLSQGLSSDSELYIYGFGRTETGRQGSISGGRLYISDVQDLVLTAIYDGTGSNTCLGDSGGPVVLRYEDEADGITRVGLVGLTSVGINLQCNEGDETVYTNLRAPGVREFIQTFAPEAVIL